MKFEDAYEEYKIYARNRHKKQGFYTLTKDFKNHILPYFKGRIVSSLTTADIINWQTEILNKHFSYNFDRNLYYTFSAFIEFCVNYSYLEFNIVLKVGNFKRTISTREYKYYNSRQFRIFYRYLDDYVLKQYFYFIFHFGTRPGEAMALKFSDVYGGYLYIHNNIQRRGNRELDTPKNQSSVRYINLSFLMRWKLFCLKCYYEKKYGRVYDYFLFGGMKPLAPTTIDRKKKIACEKAGLFEITQHQFRHSYATNKIHKGVPIDVVSKDLGHSTVSMTVDVYLHTEKRQPSCLFTGFDFFNTLTKGFKKITKSIITFFM